MDNPVDKSLIKHNRLVSRDGIINPKVSEGPGFDSQNRGKKIEYGFCKYFYLCANILMGDMIRRRPMRMRVEKTGFYTAYLRKSLVKGQRDSLKNLKIRVLMEPLKADTAQNIRSKFLSL